jgi:hypothetical protein
MYQLERLGVQAVLVDRDENDLWVRTPSGRMLTIQVKTASEPKARGRRACYNFYTENLGPSTDLYAVVALQPEIVLLCRPDEMRKRWSVDLFTPERMEASIGELLA